MIVNTKRGGRGETGQDLPQAGQEEAWEVEAEEVLKQVQQH